MLETHIYENGVFDDEGNVVIRPLTEEEKAWMNQFLAEHVGAEKLTENSIHQHSPERQKQIDKLEYDLSILKNKIYKLNIKYNAYKVRKKEGLDELDAKRVELCKKRDEIKDTLYYLDYQKYNYGSNNKRNDDIYNKLRRTGKLRVVDPELLNSYGYEDLEDYAIKHLYLDSAKNSDDTNGNTDDE